MTRVVLAEQHSTDGDSTSTDHEQHARSPKHAMRSSLSMSMSNLRLCVPCRPRPENHALFDFPSDLGERSASVPFVQWLKRRSVLQDHVRAQKLRESNFIKVVLLASHPQLLT